MKKHLTGILSCTAILVLLTISSCYSNCTKQCREHGGCYEGYCECNEGYMGDDCEVAVGQYLSGTYDVVAVSASLQDSVLYQSVFSAVPNDVTKFTLSNFHGITTVEGTISGTSAETAGPYLGLHAQSLGAAGTVEASAHLVPSNDAIAMTYTITDSSGSVEWTATFTR